MTTDPSLADVFPGDSQMAAQMRAHDWSSTPLGDPHGWPDGLKVPLRMMLTSRFQMWLGWGHDLIFFYNDAYIPTLGLKHPDALARPMKQVWREVFDAVEDRIVSVMRDGIATWDEALMLVLERSGAPEETYHTFSYSPLIRDSGATGGLMCVVSEETERVISERRIATLQALASALLAATTHDEIAEATRTALATNPRDIPFSLVSFFNHESAIADPLQHVAWPFDQVASGTEAVFVDLTTLPIDPPLGAWDVPARDALMLPMAAPGGMSPIGALVLGLNPLRHPDDDIVGFAALLAVQISGALASVDARAREAAEIERLRQLFAQSPSFMAVVRGPEHRFELMNPGYLQLVGHRDLIGKTIRDALPEVADQGYFEMLDQVYTTGQPISGRAVSVMLHRTPDAEPEQRFVDFSYQPIRSADERVSGVFVEGVDVTEKQRAVAAVLESEERFRTLTEAMRNHAWTARPDGYLDWFNTQVYNYSGQEPGSLDGPNWISIVHPDDVPVAGRRWTDAIKSGEPYEAEFRLQAADGAFRWHIARAVAQRNDSGEIVRWVGTNTDIHEQMETAQALANLNATLEQQVQERTGELMAAEEALRQSHKMEAVGQLTGGIAHDFNNLLAGITGSLDMMQLRIKQGRPPEIERYVSAAQGAAMRAAALTHRLLAFSRRQTLAPKPTDVKQLIAGMEDLIRRTAGPAIEVEAVNAAGLWPSLIDPSQLENAILNLCINARDAMPDGGRITIETANRWMDDRAARDRGLEPGQYISLCVSDTGTGMSPEIASKAFDPFFTTKPIGMGTGLGLSMIYGFARQSGGTATIYSEAGQGATLCIYLPRHLGPADVADARPEIGTEHLAGSGETVLVVEDEATVRMLIVDVLEDLGYTALEAGEGATALKTLRSDARIDLLITDVGLPGGMNGRQVADAARQHRPGLKVLFITGYAENAVLGHGHLDPGMHVLTKPFAMEALATRIRDLIIE